MSNRNLQTPSGINAVGFAVTGISLLLVIIGFFFLPWLTYADFDRSFSGLAIIVLDIDDFATDPLVGAGAAPLAVDFEWQRGNVSASGELPVYDLFPPEGGSNLAFVVLIIILVVVFVVFSYIVQTRKYDFVSAISWVSIIGIYGILFLLFFAYVSQSNRVDEFRGRLSRNVLPVASEALESESVATERLSVDNIANEVTYSNYESATGTISIGFWLTMLGLIGLTAQILIPRNLSGLSNVLSSQGGYVAASAVTSDRTVIIDAMVRQGIVSLAVVFALFPVIFVMSSAFNPSGQLSTQGVIPTNIESPGELLTNFRALLIDELELFPFWNWLFNSFVVATTSTILVVMITAMSAYSFSRFRFTGRRSLLLGILLIQVFPNLLAMVALFLILTQIGRLPAYIPEALPFLAFIDWSWLQLFGLNSLGGLILVYMGGAMGINTWLMKGFFDSIPRDIDESALVDGATHWQIFWLLIFPLVRPIIAVVGILAFVGTFNEFVLANVLLRDKEKWTLMVGLFNFVNADFNRDWGKFAAGALVSTIPVVVIYIALQDQIVGGLTAGSVKG